ncbi:CBS domain-containing protein [Lentibacillus salicampi]|uniref:CBS domain-containing protein n=1 Tax=Lentibacillus salicampi TaxID=175306 RepID=A0A4Y9AIK2_9BACI|nr:CBS domain-containing protein [Lentibacillus salicampi]TFJ94770.1 CBS domain-containing protein [Lentibacillus salicampi]
MKIKEFMIPDVISVRKDMKIKELLKTMVEHKIGGVPVVDEHNQLIGIISDGDVIRYLQPNGRTIYDAFSMVFVTEMVGLKQKVETSIEHHSEEIMKKGVYTVRPDDEIEVAVSIFSRYHFKKIPVVNDSDQVLGVISRGDIIRSIYNKAIAEMDG